MKRRYLLFLEAFKEERERWVVIHFLGVIKAKVEIVFWEAVFQ